MRSYRFGEFLLDPRERRLLRGQMAVALTPKVFDTLVHLVERHGQLVRKEELMQAIWRNACVEDGNLPRTIHVLRRALGEAPGRAIYIETVPTKGYRFVAVVTPVDRAAPPPPPVEGQGEGRPALRAAGARVRPRPRLYVFAALALVPLAAGLLWRPVEPGRHGPGAVARQPPTTNSAAYTSYQAGRWHLDRRHPGDAARALQDFEAAVQRDPRFAAAHAGIADARMLLFQQTNAHADIAEARLALDRARALDPGNAHVHTLMCRLLAVYEWDFTGAEAECRRAIALDPADDRAHGELALLLNSLGLRAEALREIDEAVALAPTSFNKRSRGLLLYFARRFPDAIAQFRQIESADPDFADASRWMGRSYEQLRDYPRALDYLLKTRTGADSAQDEVLRRAFASGGWPAVLRASLPPEGARGANLETAGSLALLGETDRAFAVLERMLEARKVMIVQIDSEPRLDPLRADPRYEDIARRAGLRRGLSLRSPRSASAALPAAGRAPWPGAPH